MPRKVSSPTRRRVGAGAYELAMLRHPKVLEAAREDRAANARAAAEHKAREAAKDAAEPERGFMAGFRGPARAASAIFSLVPGIGTAASAALDAITGLGGGALETRMLPAVKRARAKARARARAGGVLSAGTLSGGMALNPTKARAKRPAHAHVHENVSPQLFARLLGAHAHVQHEHEQEEGGVMSGGTRRVKRRAPLAEDDPRRRRAQLCARVAREHNISIIQASSLIKQRGMTW